MVEAPLPDEKQKQKDLFDQLTTLLGGFSISDSLIEYCFTNLIPDLRDDDFIEHFQLPRLAHPIDKFITDTFYSFSSEEEFEQGITQLEYLLFNTSDVDWSIWITCCDKYLFMHERGYLEVNDISELSLKLQTRLLDFNVIDLKIVKQKRFANRGYSSNQLISNDFSDTIDKLNQNTQSYFDETMVERFF